MTKQAATKDKTAQQNAAQDQPQRKQEVSVLAPARLPYHPVYKERYGVDGVTWRALVEAVYPSAKTVEGIILAISYCHAKNYDIMKKFVHVVPIWNSQLRKEVEGVWEAVAALRATAHRTGLYAGCDETNFGPIKVFHFDDEVGYGDKAERVIMDVEMPEWAQITVYRLVAGVRCAFPGPRVTYLGAYGAKGKSEIPNDKWGVSGDTYMLEKCAEAAALRKAFPEELGGINSAEEMEGRKVGNIPGHTINHDPDEPAPPRPTRESTKADEERARKDQEEREAQYRSTMTDAGQASQEHPQTVVNHDPDTGEVSESEAKEAPKDKAKQAASTDYATLTRTLVEKVEATGRPKTLDAMIQDYVDEIELLRTESTPGYDTVQDAIKKRRAYFAR